MTLQVHSKKPRHLSGSTGDLYLDELESNSMLCGLYNSITVCQQYFMIRNPYYPHSLSNWPLTFFYVKISIPR